MSKEFASQADLDVKQVSFTKLSDKAYAYTAEGDPNTGIIIGDDAVLVLDTQATPVMAQDVIRRIREVTDKPIQYLLLTHHHAVRVLGASAYGARHIIASQDTRDLIVERGEQDKASEIGRFPRLFQNVESVPPGLTWPTLTFTGKMTLWLGSLEVQLLQLGRGHTKGDTVGLAAAIDLAQQGLAVLLLDDDDTVSMGSRGLCYAKRTLEILDRLGCGQPVVDKGVTWNVGRTVVGEHEVFQFKLQPDVGHERPGMVNLQQTYLEE